MLKRKSHSPPENILICKSIYALSEERQNNSDSCFTENESYLLTFIFIFITVTWFCCCTQCTCQTIQMLMKIYLQSNLNSSNTDDKLVYHGNSSLVLSPYEILPIVQENVKFSYFIMTWYVVCTIKIHSTYNFFIENQKYFPELSSFASKPGATINPQ